MKGTKFQWKSLLFWATAGYTCNLYNLLDPTPVLDTWYLKPLWAVFTVFGMWSMWLASGIIGDTEEPQKHILYYSCEHEKNPTWL